MKKNRIPLWIFGMLAVCAVSSLAAYFISRTAMPEPPKAAEELSEEDVLIQLNASLFRKYGLFEGAEQKRFIRAVFSSGIPFFVSTDAHGGKRTPILSEAYRFVCEALGEEAAHEIFWDIPSSIFRSDEENG